MDDRSRSAPRAGEPFHQKTPGASRDSREVHTHSCARLSGYLPEEEQKPVAEPALRPAAQAPASA